ncbi:MAG: hypothetical protein J6A58_12270 [Oscillospiraceae bacterium]|nr:hypothetical protein [Oscillospiraceae bacterium]
MGMVVRTNMAGINANNALNAASKTQQNAMQKLASGFRINKAGDDASGLAISEKMKNQIKALDTATDNCEDGANMIQTAEGYMAETHDILNRMTELAEKAANGVLADEDRDALQDEMDQLCAEIDRMATTANFNGKKLMDGSIGSNAVVELKSDAENGNTYALGESGPNEVAAGTNGRYTADTADGDVIGSLTGSAKDELVAKIAKAVEGHAAAIGAEDGDELGVLVNKFGEVLVFDTEDDAVNSDVYTTDTYDDDINTGGYEALTIAVTKSEADKINKDGIKLQIGESSVLADKMEVKVNSFHTDSLFGGVGGFKNLSATKTEDADNAVAATGKNDTSTYRNAYTIKIKDQNEASAAADAIRLVSNYVSDERGKLGAQQNRLDHTVNNLTTASENITAANSRIRDTNMAEEMMNYTSKNVIAQAAQAMLAQANSQPQNVLSLLQ